MKNLTEIRWHSRGGQGAKTASILLADVAFNTGKNVQGFPEYGAERTGAPMTAYNRISDNKIRVHSNIYFPDFVIVVDDTLLKVVDVTKGLDENGTILINSNKDLPRLSKYLNGFKGKIFIIDAKTISEEKIGMYFPNTVMLAAIVKIAKIMEEEEFFRYIKESLKVKFADKPDVIEGNIEAMKDAFNKIIELQ